MKNYTTKEVAALFGVSERTIQRHIATLIETLKTPNNKGFTIPEDTVNLLLSRHYNDKTTTDSDTENSEFPHVEYFTEEEYEEFKKRITGVSRRNGKYSTLRIESIK